MLLSKCFHMVCTPARCINLVQSITAERKQIGEAQCLEAAKPMFIWEPSPSSCKPDELEDVLKAIGYVDLVSPNHTELASLFGAEVQVEDRQAASMDEMCEVLLKHLKENSAVVVRCGSRGCYVRSRTERRIIPAFHGSDRGSKVTDPTGAGNAFLVRSTTI